MSGYLLAAHVAHATHGSGFAQYIPYLVPLVIGLVIGRIWGRSVGLKHLGAYEYQNRWKGIRSVRRF